MGMLPEPEAKQFLKADVLKPLLNKQGFAKAKIAGEPTMGKYGLNVPVKIGDEPFTLTLNTTAPDYALVCKSLGRDPEDWVKRILRVGIREAEYKTGEKKGELGQFVNIVGVE